MKNHEGYPDPTANEAINGVRKEEKQRLLEKKHGFKRGEKVVTIKMLRDEMHKEAKKKKLYKKRTGINPPQIMKYSHETYRMGIQEGKLFQRH